MGLFRLDEVLQIAMQAEESGRLLYETVAKETADPKVADLCRQLAIQEGRHYEKFKAMKEAAPNQMNSRRLSLEEMDFVQGLTQGRVTPLEAEAKRIVRDNSPAEVLDMAVQAEKDSAAFYEQILTGVDAADAGAIREIIEEEDRHRGILTDLRKALNGQPNRKGTIREQERRKAGDTQR